MSVNRQSFPSNSNNGVIYDIAQIAFKLKVLNVAIW